MPFSLPPLQNNVATIRLVWQHPSRTRNQKKKIQPSTHASNTGKTCASYFLPVLYRGKNYLSAFLTAIRTGKVVPFFCPAIRSKIALQNWIVISSRQDAHCRHGTAETASGKYFDIGQTTSHQQFIAHGSVGSLHTVSRSLAIVKRFCVCYFPPVLLLSRKRKCAFCLVYFVCVCVRVGGADWGWSNGEDGNCFPFSIVGSIALAWRNNANVRIS